MHRGYSFHPDGILPATQDRNELKLTMENRIVSPFRNNEVLAITEEGYRHLLTEMAGGRASRQHPEPKARGGVAIIPIHGTTVYFDSHFGVNTVRIGDAIEAAANTKGISRIILDIDSPGGTAAGNIELADRILVASMKTPVVAIANPLAASAAYYFGSAANRFYVTPSGDGGSIGTYTMHVDESEMLKKMGIKIKIIKAGKFKAEGNSFQPLTPESEKYIQSQINELNSDFVRTVARNRGVSVSYVEENFGQGRTMVARQAVAAGLFDGIRTLPNLIAQSSNEKGQRSVRSMTNDARFTEKLQEAWHNGYASQFEHMSDARRDQLVLQRRDREKVDRIKQLTAGLHNGNGSR
ncbi:S49 family peptidase [Bremerella sp. T1]|uniref:S49 family peptidase n=1 Tax=Bremerella sp. TYQ1 TaxID=3119568 RepID=UPI001CCD3B39|nr:S49 family peptidase [Bremerella volcania]UBM37374.1 S49 family peptidase [Bremerella volcania]